MTNIWPAIDLLNNKCVRLEKGIYDSEKIYSENPLAIAQKFEKIGLENLHIVDLNGAKSGKTENWDGIKKIVKNTNLKTEVGGGIRDTETIEKYLELGINRIILGSAAIQNPEFLETCLTQFGTEKIVLGVDVKKRQNTKLKNNLNDYEIFISGWTENSGILASNFLNQTKAKHILMTDISRDGMLTGANFNLYKKFIQEFPKKSVIVSGGIADYSDIKQAIKIGCEDIIIGKAIYERRIELADLVKITP